MIANDTSRTPRLLSELRQLAMLTGYFYVIFVVLVLYKATILHSYGVRYVVWGRALVEAVLIAKFTLISRTIKIGGDRRTTPLLKLMALRVLILLILLLFLTSAEKCFVGLLHHQSLMNTYHSLLGSSSGEVFAEVMILLLALIPLVALDLLCESLGSEELRTLLFHGGKVKVVQQQDRNS